MGKEEAPATIQLGRWEVRPAELRVVSGDVEHLLEAKVMDVLLALLEHPGEVIKRGTLIDHVWGSEFGGDESLTRAISLLRKALGDTRGSHEHIRTIPRQGYQLVAHVEQADDTNAGTALSPTAELTAAPRPTDLAPFTQRRRILTFVTALIALGLLSVFGRGLVDLLPAKQPLIVIMDSAHPARVYDQGVYEAGGTNADTLSNILGDLPVRTQKELISPNWNRFEAIAKFEPDLILIHYSGFKQENAAGPRPQLKLLIRYFLNTDTRFLIYSRAGKGWLAAKVEALLADLATTQPNILKRVDIYPLLEHGEPSWLDAGTSQAIKLKIKDTLKLQ